MIIRKKSTINFIAISILLLGYCFQLTAQDRIRDSIKLREDSIAKIPLMMSVTYSGHTNDISPIPSIDYLISRYDPFGQITLNNYGSPILFNRGIFKLNEHLNHGFGGTSFFHKDIDHFPIYHTNKLYSEVSVSEGKAFGKSQSGLVNNLTADALFTGSYRNNIHWTLIYNRINQLGIYQNSKNLLSSFGTGIQYYSPDQRLGFNICYINNRDLIGHNHGIIDSIIPKLILTDYGIRESVPSYSATASTSIKNSQYGFHSYYTFNHNTPLFKPTIHLSSAYHSYEHLFADGNISSSGNYYPYALILDTGSIHRIYHQYSWDTKLKLTLNNYFSLSYGYETNHVSFDSSITEIPIHHLGLEGHLKWYGYHFNVEYKNKKQQNKNETGISLELVKPFTSLGQFEMRFNQFTHIPSLLFQKFYLQGFLQWDNQFNNVSIQSFDVKWLSNIFLIPNIDFNLSNIKHLVFFNSQARPVQYNDALRYIHLTASKRFNLKHFSTLHKVDVHSITPNVTGWSAWQSYHDLSINGFIFKKSLDARFGVAALINAPSTQFKYQSYTDQFYPIGSYNETLVPTINAFLTLRVDEFTAKINFEHIDSFWEKKRPNYIFGYPEYDFFARIILQWKFIN